MKLLIVDDSAMVRRLIEAAYRGSVFTDIQTAADGLLAVTMYKQFSPDVVTLDITMPHMDGLAALAQILEHNPGAKVLVVSALADHHTAIESLKRGASQFICKPFSAEDLRAALDEVINPPVARRSKSRRRRRESSPPTAPALPNAPVSELGSVTGSSSSPALAVPAPESPPVPQMPAAGTPGSPIIPFPTPVSAPSSDTAAIPPSPAPLTAPPVPGMAPVDPVISTSASHRAEGAKSEIPPAPDDYPSGYVRPPIRPPMPLTPPSDTL